MSTPSFTLNTGAKIPAIGLGTWQSEKGQVAKAVEAAIKSGYRHIDAAWIYGNEKEVGEGIKNSGIPREELFVTTKVWGTYHRDPQKNLAKSLENLGLDYVDLLLVHWPVPLNPASGENIPLRPDGSRDIDEEWSPEKTWALMEKIPETGKAKAVGVSNWSIPFLEKLLKISTVVPAANQVENHPYLPQEDLVKFCKEKGILLQAYSPLGSTGAKLLQDDLIIEIAKAHSADPSQVVISYQVQRGVNPLPKSVTPSRIETNGKLIQLSDEEMKKLGDLHKQEGKGKRLIAPKWGVPLGFGDL